MEAKEEEGEERKEDEEEEEREEDDYEEEREEGWERGEGGGRGDGGERGEGGGRGGEGGGGGRVLSTLLVFLGLYSDEPLIVKVVDVKQFRYRPGQTLKVPGG